MKRDESTYGRVRDKFEEWKEIQATRPERPRVIAPARPYTPEPRTGSSDMGKTAYTAIGVGIGVILLLLAGLTLANAARWGDYARDGAVVGYTVAGLFLVLAGLGGIIATLNHNFRVLPEAHRQKAHSH